MWKEQGNLLFFVLMARDMDIVTNRLCLRPLSEADAPAIAAKINTYAIAKNLSRVPFPYHLSDAVEFLSWVKNSSAHSAFRAICLRSDRENLLGIISYEWSEEKHDSEIGYWLVEQHWGKGLMSEAVNAMADHAFRTSDVKRMVACFFDENPASGRVLFKAGFELVGACMSFSKSRGVEVPVTNVQLKRHTWENKKTAP